jgi:hypothetical protein
LKTALSAESASALVLEPLAEALPGAFTGTRRRFVKEALLLLIRQPLLEVGGNGPQEARFMLSISVLLEHRGDLRLLSTGEPDVGDEDPMSATRTLISSPELSSSEAVVSVSTVELSQADRPRAAVRNIVATTALSFLNPVIVCPLYHLVCCGDTCRDVLPV